MAMPGMTAGPMTSTDEIGTPTPTRTPDDQFRTCYIN